MHAAEKIYGGTAPVIDFVQFLSSTYKRAKLLTSSTSTDLSIFIVEKQMVGERATAEDCHEGEKFADSEREARGKTRAFQVC